MLTILCIDDDPATLTLRGDVLRAEGFQVLTASTGGEGVDLANAYKCDVVVLDYSLPDMKGEAVAGILKYSFPNLPIVLCSGHDDLPDSVFKLVDAFVAKGDIPDFLLMTIQSVIGRKKLPRREQSFQRRERKG